MGNPWSPPPIGAPVGFFMALCGVETVAGLSSLSNQETPPLMGTHGFYYLLTSPAGAQGLSSYFKVPSSLKDFWAFWVCLMLCQAFADP